MVWWNNVGSTNQKLKVVSSWRTSQPIFQTSVLLTDIMSEFSKKRFGGGGNSPPVVGLFFYRVEAVWWHSVHSPFLLGGAVSLLPNFQKWWDLTRSMHPPKQTWFLTISNETIFFFKTQGTGLGAIVALNKGLE